MNDDEIRELRDTMRGMSIEESVRLTELLLEPEVPEPMTYAELAIEISRAEDVLVNSFGTRTDLARFAGDIIRHWLVTWQSSTLVIEGVSVYQRTIRPNMRPKIIVRTYPVNGVRYFASIDTWREGDR